MSRKKIIAAGLFALLLAGGGTFYYLKSRDHYDPSKYKASIAHTENTAQSEGEEDRAGLFPGTRVELTLPDQFDVARTIGPEVTTLLLVFSKDSGGLVRGFLDEQDKNFLETKKAIFIADISPMPVVIRNTFALPKLRESSYSVLLLYEEEMSRALQNPDHEDEITIATLSGNVVKDVRYISTRAELAEVFRSTPQ